MDESWQGMNYSCNKAEQLRTKVKSQLCNNKLLLSHYSESISQTIQHVHIQTRSHKNSIECVSECSLTHHTHKCFQVSFIQGWSVNNIVEVMGGWKRENRGGGWWNNNESNKVRPRCDLCLSQGSPWVYVRVCLCVCVLDELSDESKWVTSFYQSPT